MSVQRHGKGWRVRWKNPDGSLGSKTLSLKRDAVAYDAEVKRRKRLGQLADLDAGTESLNDYVASVWAPSFGAMLAPKARKLYSGLYDTHLSPTLGSVPLREIRPELISRWQADRPGGWRWTHGRGQELDAAGEHSSARRREWSDSDESAAPCAPSALAAPVGGQAAAP